MSEGTDQPNDLGGGGNAVPDEDRLLQRIIDSIAPDSRVVTVELLITVILAIAGVLTAWSALQSAKWSGEQAISFSEAGASRTESTRFDGRATSVILLDSQTFLQWVQAYGTDTVAAVANDVDPPDPTSYDPENASLSGFLFTQFREEFRPRVDEWYQSSLTADGAAPSPFFPLEEYIAESVPAAAEAERLLVIADEKAADARKDNQNSDDYVVTVVLLASVLFFAGVSSKMRAPRNQSLMFILSLAMLLWAGFRLITLPIHAIP
ncbi:MAG: hypothetical protein ACC652_06130 [Acidimicrobiales bacterium]